MIEFVIWHLADHTKRETGVQDIDDPRAWIAELTNRNLRSRRAARDALAHMGERAVAPLIGALNSRDEQLRWEAAKTLVEISSPTTIPVLIGALEDENCDVRFLAAQGLIAQGSHAWVPLLQALEHHSGSILFREGAHRVLYQWARGDLAPILLPVIVALEDVEPSLEAPVAAFQALQALRNNRG